MNEASGWCNEIILVTRSGKESIENHFDAHYELGIDLKEGQINHFGAVKI